MDSDDPIRLVAEIQAGLRLEENSARLFHKYQPAIRSFFHQRGFDPEESEDLAQDVFLRVFKGIDTFRRESRFERWLWEIAANIYFNEVRRRRTEKRDALEQSLDIVVQDEEDQEPLSIPSQDPSPEEEVIRNEQLIALRAALKHFPDQMRRCCVLRYERGLKYQEIALQMNISIETVKAHLHQSRKRLTELLGPY